MTENQTDREAMFRCDNGNCAYVFPENEALQNGSNETVLACPLCGSVSKFAVSLEADGSETADEIELPDLKVKVSGFTSSRGNDVPNQYRIETADGIYFQSYSSIIAFRRFSDRQVFLDRDKWNYSRTTARYRNEFLNETTKETEKKIKDGIYKLVVFNK